MAQGALIGRTLGDFVVREELGRGGFGDVYRAEQPLLQREAVIKVLSGHHRRSEESTRRFMREARLASQLDHPYAAHIYAFGAEPDGLRWIAMELVRGTSLRDVLDTRGRIELIHFVSLLERICEVVHAAHEERIIHRDIKPDNIMVLSRSGRLLPKLLDFGIARVAQVTEDIRPPSGSLGDDDELAVELALETPAGSLDTRIGATIDRITKHGALVGSPHYMAPEQWVDAKSADARVDQYALAALSYEALTGIPAFDGRNLRAIAMAHAKRAIPPLGDGVSRPARRSPWPRLGQARR